MRTYAVELVAQLNEALPSALSTPSSTAAVPSTTQANQQERLRVLQSALTTLGSKSSLPSSAHLLKLAEDTFPPFQGLASLPSADPLLAETELLVAVQLALVAYGVALDELVDAAVQAEEEEGRWGEVQDSVWDTGFYLFQTTPTRLFSLARLLVERFTETSSLLAERNLPFRTLLQHSIPPRPLLVGSAFPHLLNSTSEGRRRASSSATAFTAGLNRDPAEVIAKATSKLILLPTGLLSFPLRLTKDEISARRRRLKHMRQALVADIDELASASAQIQDVLEKGEGQAVLEEAAWRTLRTLDGAISPSGQSTLSSATATGGASEIAVSVQHFLRSTLVKQRTLFTDEFETLSRPAGLAKNWPYWVFGPLLGIYSARVAYNSRATIASYVVDAKETVKGFWRDWVLEPCIKILETVRHGESGMAIMGKESLNSDLASLERMVVDFAKDQYKLPPNELEALGEQVRKGDLTSVLKVWEQDIKSPVKNAITGSLVRTLLIQVQKVKVDVDLAMDGIEKMLKSQQLTFAFVGVAPSLLIVWASSRGLGTLFKRSTSGGRIRTEGQKKRDRKRVWKTLREVQDLVDGRIKEDQDLVPADGGARLPLRGEMIVRLATLRQFALSGSFPSSSSARRKRPEKDEVIRFFLDDVARLENASVQAEREKALHRLESWKGVLKLDEALV